MEPETDLFDLYKASIVGTGKSIDFYFYLICLKLFKVGYYPLLPLACACCLIYTTVVYFDHTLSLSFDLIDFNLI